MSFTTCSEGSFDGEAFDWNKYLLVRSAEEVPGDFFHHVCKSEQNGIEIGSVVEVENKNKTGYWFASVCSSKGVLINLHYFGDENDKHDFWLEVKSLRIHPLNWGRENKKKLVPPYPNRFSRVKAKVIKEKVQDCENALSNAILQMGGAPIHNIFKSEMFVEVQDKEFPYRVWISKILKNVGGRLFLKMEGGSSPEKEPFWLFYLNDRIFPFGWAEQKGLPWRVMNLNANIKNAINSSLLLNVLKPKTPKQHSYKVGEMLEVVNPYSLMVFYVATIVKIYDNRYFKVEVDNDIDTSKRISFVATKENPFLFSTGWAKKHKFPLQPPSDWTTLDPFCWSKYALMKNSKLAEVDNTCRKKIDHIHIGMKLEAVDPLNPDYIRVATLKGFSDRWMFLSFDRTSWCQELLHLRSIYSDDVFPVGWCNKHKYPLKTPKLPFIDCNEFENCYYDSDDNIDFNKFDKNNSETYSHYIKGDIPYHFSKKNYQNFEDNLEESIKNILDGNSLENLNVENSDVSKTVNQIHYETNINIKLEPPPELDEEFHDALFLEEEVSSDSKTDPVRVKEEINNDPNTNICLSPTEGFYNYNYEMCVYFNKNCYSGSHIVKKKAAELPDSLGPGPVSKILQEAITLFVNANYFPYNALRKIKKIQSMLFNGPGGIELVVHTNDTKYRVGHFESLLLPESREMAQSYCYSLCNLSGICEYFMTTKQTPCNRGCSIKHITISKLKFEDENTSSEMKAMKNNAECLDSDDLFKDGTTPSEKIAKTAISYLNWSNKALVEKYRHILSCIILFEAQLRRLNRSKTNEELILSEEIKIKENCLRKFNKHNYAVNIKSDFTTVENLKFSFFGNWKCIFEKYYQSHSKYSKTKIDIGDFQPIKVTSNPKHWSPDDVLQYLSNDENCKDFVELLNEKEVDGVAFMILNEEILLCDLECPINLAIRIMCHIAEVKYVCLTKYSDL